MPNAGYSTTGFFKTSMIGESDCCSLMHEEESLHNVRETAMKKPSGPSLKLLNIIDQKGVDALV